MMGSLAKVWALFYLLAMVPLAYFAGSADLLDTMIVLGTIWAAADWVVGELKEESNDE